MTTRATELSGRSIERESPHTNGFLTLKGAANVSSVEMIFGWKRA